MTPLAEAVLLPGMFLTVLLAAAIRPGAERSLVPATPASLLVAVVLLALLVRSGTIAPARVVSPARSRLANLNGLTLLATAFAASAQIVTALMPESGVPALLSWCVLVALLLQAFAVDPDRPHLLRGLLVTFGVAFTLKFVVLAAISAPAEGRMARALQFLFEGVTLGGVTQRPPHPAEAYLAFAACALYLIGVALLPSGPWRTLRAPHAELPAPSEPRRLQ